MELAREKLIEITTNIIRPDENLKDLPGFENHEENVNVFAQDWDLGKLTTSTTRDQPGHYEHPFCEKDQGSYFLS